MGFFSSLLGAVLPVAGGLLGLPALTTPTVAPAVAPAIVAAAPGAMSLIVPGTTAAPVASSAVAAPGFVSSAVSTISGVLLDPLGVPKAIANAIDTAFSSGAPEKAARSAIAAGGNGQVHRVTIVLTIDNRTGALVNRIVLQGAPFLMNQQVSQLKRTVKLIGKANQKIPRRVVKESLTSELTREIKTSAIRQITACPPVRKDC